MKRYLFFPLILILLFVVSACVRSVGPISSPVPSELPQVVDSPTTPPETEPPPQSPTPQVLVASLTPTSQDIQPADTPVPPTEPPPTTAPEPTATTVPTDAPEADEEPTPAVYDPQVALGKPDFSDPMNSGSYINWVSESGEMPDTANIRLRLSDGELVVTGKNQFFDTWWFTWPNVDNFFVEMKMETEDCSGKDAYGLILRGPLRGTGYAYGYIVAFSCDGHYLVRRLDNSEPYEAIDLLSWNKTSRINKGSEEENTIGVRVKGDSLIVFANGFRLKRVRDESFAKGRYGVFVSANETPNFTYRVDELSYWELEE